MTKEQAKEEYLKLLTKRMEDEEKIYQEAKANGNWIDGLDTNDRLFDELNNDFKAKVELLKTMVDE